VAIRLTIWIQGLFIEFVTIRRYRTLSVTLSVSPNSDESTDCAAQRCSAEHALAGIAIATMTSLRHRPTTDSHIPCRRYGGTVPVLLVLTIKFWYLPLSLHASWGSFLTLQPFFTWTYTCVFKVNESIVELYFVFGFSCICLTTKIASVVRFRGLNPKWHHQFVPSSWFFSQTRSVIFIQQLYCSVEASLRWFAFSTLYLLPVTRNLPFTQCQITIISQNFIPRILSAVIVESVVDL